MADDHIRVEAAFPKLEAAVQQFVARLEEELKTLQAKGDTVRAASVEAQIAGLRSATGAGGKAAIDEATAALQRERAALAENLDLNLRNLEALRLQARERLALAELNRRAQTPQVIVPAERRYASYGQTAGVQAEAESYTRLQQEQNALRERGVALEAEQLALDRSRAEEMVRQSRLLDAQLAKNARAFSEGRRAAAGGGLLPSDKRDELAKAPPGLAAEWSAGNAEVVRYNTSLGEYSGFASRANLTTAALNSNVTRLGVAYNQASSDLRRHGALTTEYLSALARGETTVGEFGYQLGATIGKFSGWVTAAAATYAAFGAVAEFGKGAADAATGVQRLTRTIDGLDTHKANAELQALSKDTNVPIKEAADAVFRFSRTFHNLNDATTAARLGLSAFKLDGVSLNDSVKASTAIHQQFGLSAAQLKPVYDELAAGQREYNARITEMIPLLQKSTGAVKNAGGDLNGLLQLGVYAQRITQLSGAQVGTAFYRSAATFLNPATTKGKADRGVLEELGINPNQGWTKVLQDALIKSVSLSPEDRSRVANAIFGPQYGGRLSGIFNPQGIPTYRQIAGLGGDPRAAITPEATRGSLQQELDRELKGFHERLHSFVNELQREGAALGASGIINNLGELLRLITTVGGAFRGVVNTFADMPGPIKQAAEAALALRLAMLFLGRTRFGASIPGSKYFRIPGVDPSSEEQQARATLSRGTGEALKQVESDIARTNAELLASGAKQASLERQRAVAQQEVAAGGRGAQAALERSNKIDAEISRLKAQQVELESEQLAQREAALQLTKQQVGLSSSRGGAGRYSKDQVFALQRGISPDAQAPLANQEAARAASEGAYARRLSALTTARNSLSSAFNYSAARVEEGIAATGRNVTAIGGMIGRSEASIPVVLSSGGLLTRFASRIGGLVSALDPLTLAIIGLPFLIEGIKKLEKSASNTEKYLEPGAATSIQQLDQQVQRASKSVGGSYTTGNPLHDFNPFQESEDSHNARGDAQAQLANLDRAIKAARQHTFASPVQQVGFSMKELSDEAAADVRAFQGHKISKQELVRRMNELQRSAHTSLEVLTAPTTEKANQAISDLTNDVKGRLAKALDKASRNIKDFFDALAGLNDKQLSQRVQASSARADVYGLDKNELKKAGETYLYLAARYRNSTDENQLRLVQTAQQAFVGAFNKNVQDLLKAAESQTTFSGQAGDINAAIGQIAQGHAQIRAWVAEITKKFHNYPAIVKYVNQAAKELDAQLNDQLKSAIQQQLQLIKAQSDLTTARIPGISPEADVARAQSALNGLRQQLAAAQRDHADYQVIAGLMAQIDNAQRDLIKQRIDNARALLEAQGQLATAAITGIGPEADIARARQDVTNAQNLLSFDRSHGAGQTKVIQDQIALDNQVRSLNQQLQQRAQQIHQQMAALIESQTALAQSQTLDPIKQAREQLAGDIQVLGTIQRSDYQSDREYQTALNNQQAKINQDRIKVRDQITQTQLSTLQFEFDIQKIGDQQYINSLQHILRTAQLTREERQRIREQIYQLRHQASNLDLNVGNIKLPSIYEIRRAIGLGKRGEVPGAQGTVINHSAVVNVYVRGPRGASAVGAVIDNHLNTSVKSAMRAKGVI